MSSSPGDLRRIAQRLAYEAGTQALAGRRSLGVGQPALHDTKSTITDPVTEFDRAAEALIVGELRRLRPDDGIVGEEGADITGTSGIDWHLDPIDGTVNFVYDLPMWCTSVAAVDAQGSVAGAVYAPVLGEMFSAARGAGATLDGVPLANSEPMSLEMALVGTGFSYLPDRRRAQGARVAAMIPHVRDIRRYGSAALDLCLTACGRLDAYFEEHLNSWDIAAGILIASEAGAVTSDFRGGTASTDGVVVAGAGIHAALIELIAAATIPSEPPDPLLAMSERTGGWTVRSSQRRDR
ncbi:MAG: inositol monophosphatase family protein [Ilumatobacteraceae bacterium]